MVFFYGVVYFSGKKDKLLKTLLTCTPIPGLLNSFDLPSSSLGLRKRYTFYKCV